MAAALYIFSSDDVSALCAPTGAAAFRGRGVTIHSFLELNIHDFGKKISNKKRQRLLKKLKHLLLLIFYERSLISMGVLGAAEHHCRQTCHGRGHNKNVPWGNIPIVLLLGDDYQLPSVSVGKKGFGATRIFDIDGNRRTEITDITVANGASQFLEFVKKVIQLQQPAIELKLGTRNSKTYVRVYGMMPA